MLWTKVTQNGRFISLFFIKRMIYKGYFFWHAVCSP